MPIGEENSEVLSPLKVLRHKAEEKASIDAAGNKLPHHYAKVRLSQLFFGLTPDLEGLYLAETRSD